VGSTASPSTVAVIAATGSESAALALMAGAALALGAVAVVLGRRSALRR
jgi:LPXTG-motif cell wall-anchored protein